MYQDAAVLDADRVAEKVDAFIRAVLEPV